MQGSRRLFDRHSEHGKDFVELGLRRIEGRRDKDMIPAHPIDHARFPTHEQTEPARSLDHPAMEPERGIKRCAAFPVGNEFDPHERAFAANVADQLVATECRLRASKECALPFADLRDEVMPVEIIEHRKARSTGHGMPRISIAGEKT